MHLKTIRQWAIAASLAVVAGLAGTALLAAAPLAVTPFEIVYNPFGDPWASRAEANPSIPVGLTPACSRYGPKASSGGPVEEEIRFIATSSSRLVFEECSFLIDADDGIGDQRQRAYIAALKARNGALKYLAFFEPAIAHLNHLVPGVQPPYHVGAVEIDTNHEDWFVHVDGQPATRENRVRHVPNSPGLPSQSYLYDVTNPQFRAFIVQKAVASMALHDIDGVVVEQCGDTPVYRPDDPSNRPPQAFLNAWAGGCIELLRELTQAARPTGRLVFFLGNNTGAFATRLDVTDGMFWEDPLGGVKSSPVNPPSEVDAKFSIFRLVQDQVVALEQQQGRDKYLGVVVNTNAQGQATYLSTNPEEQRHFATYYLAAYLTQFRQDKPEKTPLIYYTPTQIGEQFRSTTSFTDWNIKVGAPLGPPAAPDEQARYRREFEQARVFLNGSDTPWSVNLADRPLLDANGQLVTSAIVPPRSGAIFRAAAAVCSPRPSVTITTARGAPGTLNVTVKSGLGPIQSLRFGDARSALVDIPNGPTGSSGGFTHTPSGNVSQLTFTVRRNGPGGATVPFVVADVCGEWPTFVGGGPNAF